jgi:hypothetical protein
LKNINISKQIRDFTEFFRFSIKKGVASETKLSQIKEEINITQHKMGGA